MEQWICESIGNVLGEDVAEDLTQYILAVESEADFEDYMKDLLDFSVKNQRDLYENIKSAKFGSYNYSRNQSNKGRPNNSAKSSSYDHSSNSKKSINVTTNNVKSANPEMNSRKSTIQEQAFSSSGTADGTKKKTKKFRKFQLNELQKGYLREGRNPCECQATKHKLINNCIECGRIVCEQEGSGPCFFCDNMVCTKEELEILNSDTKESDALYRSLTDRKKSETWKKAIQNRNKLLDFDKSVIQHTKIIDDEHDYFEVNNQWLSKKDREKAAKKLEKIQEHKHGSRLGARKIVLDILGRQAIEDNNFTLDAEDEEESVFDDYQKCVYQPYIPDIDTLMQSLKTDKANFKENELCMSVDKLKICNNSKNALFMDNYIIQDKTYLEMSDKGMCLSMHQPWASLLVLGIKQHEGRTWYTPHRGTLWIASTSKPAEPDTIKNVEDFYKEYYLGTNIQFPDKYPTGSLLGNVLVQDCLSQEEYREQFLTGESDSLYVLICSDPQKLIVPIPMKGEHKIYKLNSGIHTMARDALLLKKRFAV